MMFQVILNDIAVNLEVCSFFSIYFSRLMMTTMAMSMMFFLRFFSVSILKKQIPTQRYFARPTAVNFGNNSHIRCQCDDIERRVTPACVEFWIG